MPKPYPIIYLPKVPDQERLIRALHRMGYRFPVLGDRLDDENHTWAQWSEGGSAMRYPWVYVGPRWYMSASAKNATDGFTVVNSIPHFLSYTCALIAQSVAAQPHA